MQRLAASVKAKDICNGEGDMLIVGGGEIDMMGSSEEESGDQHNMDRSQDELPIGLGNLGDR